MAQALERLDAPAVNAWLQRAAADLDARREEIDRLNVFPVADADTGTNLAVTLRAAADAVSSDGSGTAGGVLAAAAAAAALAARGNSGVIVGQWLRGLADAIGTRDSIDAPELAVALGAAAKTARDAVSDPVDGTVLSVALAAARAGETDTGDLGARVRAVRDAAAEALASTPAQLEVLGRAGVVDAGGQGLLIVIDALLATVAGDTATPGPAVAAAAPAGCPAPADTGAGSAGPAWEVQYLLAAPGPTDELRRALDALGTSVVLGRVDDHRVRVHVHTDDVGAALEAGMRAGQPSGVEITALPSAEPARAQTRSDRALLAVVTGAGIRAVFAAAGARTVELDPAHPEAAADALTAAIADAAQDGARVVVLPGSVPPALVDRAAGSSRQDGADVTVVPTHSPVQALAAVAVHDASRRFGDDLIAMAEAAAATRVAELRVATGEALTMAGRCAPGDVLGSIAGEIVVIGRELAPVAAQLIDRLLAVGGELVTVLLGETADTGLGAALALHLATTAPHAEIVVHAGGQPDPPLIIGVE